MRKLRTEEEKRWQRESDAFDEIRNYCKNCGASLVFTKTNKRICPICGYYAFKTNLDEFKYRLKEQMNRRDYVRENQNQMAG